MSGRIVQEVLCNAPEDLTPAELLVYLVLAENARDATRQACLESVEIARRARVSVNTVHKAQSALTKRGLLVPRLTARIGITQRYVLTPLDPAHRHATIRKPSSVARLDRATDQPEPSHTARQEPSQGRRLTPVDNSADGDPSLPTGAKEPSHTARPLRTTNQTSKSLTGSHEISVDELARFGGN